jgi:hypothetical protein
VPDLATLGGVSRRKTVATPTKMRILVVRSTTMA